jgi:acetamidase/formamidase
MINAQGGTSRDDKRQSLNSRSNSFRAKRGTPNNHPQIPLKTQFLSVQVKISELDAYALCSIAVSFRVTQVVDIVRGVHALIPKSIFASELMHQMTMV